MSADPDLLLRHVVLEDGSHIAVCRACGHESRVKVRHVRDSSQPSFVLRRDPNGKPLDTATAEVAQFDFGAHRRHVKAAH